MVSSALRDRRHLSRLLFLSQTWQPAIRPFSPDCKLPLCAAAGGEMDLFVERRVVSVMMSLPRVNALSKPLHSQYKSHSVNDNYP